MPSEIQFKEPTKKPDNVRFAVPSDAQQIYDMLKDLYTENTIFPMSPHKVKEQIVQGCLQNNGVIGVIEENGVLAGSVGIFANQYWYTEAWNLEEYWNFVQPDFRRKPYGRDLVDFAKWFNENAGFILSMGIMSTHRTEAKCRLYDRKLTRIGAYFMNGIPNGMSLPSADEAEMNEISRFMGGQDGQ